MIFSTTEIQNFNRCNRLWGLTSFNQQSLTKRVHSVALSTGTLWHLTMAEWMMNADKDPVDLMMDNYQRMLQDAVAVYRAQHGHNVMKEELEPIHEAGGMCLDMARNYRDFYKTPLPEGFRPIMPEQTILVPIPNSEQECLDCDGMGTWLVFDGAAQVERLCESCQGTGTVSHQLECTFDGVCVNERERIYVIERKTYGNRPKLETLHNNFQFIVYEWASLELKLGKMGGLLYDGVWKRSKPPTGKKMEDLFLRLPIEANEHRLSEIGRYLGVKSKQMYTAAKVGDPLLDFNRRWEGCWDCGVSDLCESMSNGEDTDYLRRKLYTIREKTPAFRKDEED